VELRRTWIDEVDGKVKSLPQVPGYVPEPNSAQDWLMPNHLNLPLEEVEVLPDADDVVVIFRVVAAVLGTH
jgi:hypothetical protein